MKRIIALLFLASSMGLCAAETDIRDMKTEMSRFQKAVHAFEHRLKLWERCLKGTCTPQEQEIAKSDLKKAGAAVATIGAAVVISIGARHFYGKYMNKTEAEKIEREKSDISHIERFITGYSFYNPDSGPINDITDVKKSLAAQKIDATRKIESIDSLRDLFQSKSAADAKKLANARVVSRRVGSLEKPLYILAAERDKPEIIDLFAQYGADIARACKYSLAGEIHSANVVTGAIVLRHHYDTAIALLKRYVFDWNSLLDQDLGMFISRLMDDRDQRAKEIFNLAFKQQPSTFDRAIKNLYEKYNDSDSRTTIKEFLQNIGYDLSKLP